MKKTDLPSGVAVRTEKGSFLVKKGSLLRIPTEEVFKSWNFPIVVDSDYEAIKHYPITGKIGFRDGTVIKAFGSRKVYLISAQRARHVTDPRVLNTLGIDPSQYLIVSDSEVASNMEGEQIGSIQADSMAAK